MEASMGGVPLDLYHSILYHLASASRIRINQITSKLLNVMPKYLDSGMRKISIAEKYSTCQAVKEGIENLKMRDTERGDEDVEPRSGAWALQSGSSIDSYGSK